MPRKPMRAAGIGGLMEQLSLGAIMKVLPRGRVDEALRRTRTESQRRRLLPAPMVLYLVVLLALYAEASVRENLRLLLEPLRRLFGLDRVRVASGAAISQARQKLGAAPLRWLFERVAKPVGSATMPGCVWRGLRVVALDATSAQVQASAANCARFGVHTNQHGAAGYPQLKLAVLLECATRAPLGAALGGVHTSDPALFDRLRERLDTTMLLLVDRIFYSFERFDDCARRAGALVWRVARGLRLAPIERLSDGSYLAEVAPSGKLIAKGLSRRGQRRRVRVIEYRPVYADGTQGELVRLVTTLLDARAAPASELAALYPQRWQVETGFDELKTHLRGAERVLRSPRPDLVEQEVYGFLLAYYVVRATMAEAARRARCAAGALSFAHAVRVIRRRLSFFPSDE